LFYELILTIDALVQHSWLFMPVCQ